MCVRSNLIEGVYGNGKTSACKELQRRVYRAIHGDRELSHQGDPGTGDRTDGVRHEHHILYIDKVKSLVENQDNMAAFFCGGSRSFPKLST